MGFLFDTSAISEVFKPRPNARFVEWLGALPRDQQYTSTVVVGDLFAGAFAAPNTDKWLRRIREQVLPRLVVLPFDSGCAEYYGRVRATLRLAGTPIGDADTLIAATALRHGLHVVTANVRHFSRVDGLVVRSLSD